MGLLLKLKKHLEPKKKPEIPDKHPLELTEKNFADCENCRMLFFYYCAAQHTAETLAKQNDNLRARLAHYEGERPGDILQISE